MSVFTQIPTAGVQQQRHVHYGAHVALASSATQSQHMKPQPLRMNPSSTLSQARALPNQGAPPVQGIRVDRNTPPMMAQLPLNRGTIGVDTPRVRPATSVVQATPLEKSHTAGPPVSFPQAVAKPPGGKANSSRASHLLLPGAQHASTPQSCRRSSDSHSPGSTASTASSETARFPCSTPKQLSDCMEDAVAHCNGHSPGRSPCVGRAIPQLSAEGTFKCPGCGAFAATIEKAVAHCGLDRPVIACAHSSANLSHRADASGQQVCAEGTFKCPGCGAFAATIDEAVAHCGLDKPHQVTGQSICAPCEESAAPSGEVIAYDSHGRPTIVRQTDSETGVQRTIVQDEAGSRESFGDDTVGFLTRATEEEINEWMTSLTCQQLRGLSHEVGQRLVDGSRVYHEGLAELDKLYDHLNYLYFGLTTSSTEKDLDIAYRKLARKMHPDKNGGTEEAKRRFQDMKERYEALKKKFGENGTEDLSQEAETEHLESIKDATRYVPVGRHSDVAHQANYVTSTPGKPEERAPKVKATKEDTDESPVVSSNYDPKDKTSMMEYVSKVACQLHDISEQKTLLMKKLNQARVALNEIPEESNKGGCPCLRRIS